MVGRIPILHVMPVVDLGRQAAKATVGEPMPVSATVFREGHDRLGAGVVLTDPTGNAARPIPHGQAPRASPTTTRRSVTPDVEGAWTFEVEAWSRPVRHLAARRRDQDPGRDRRRADVHRGPAAVRACATRPRRAPDEDAGPRGRDRRGRRTQAPGRGAPRGAPVPRGRRVLAAHPLRDLVTIEGPYPMYVDRTAPRTAPGTSSSRAPRAPPSTQRPARSPAATSAPRQAARRRRRHGLRRRLPAADPPDRRGQPQGPQQHADARPRRPGSPWAIGSKDGGHDAIHPDLGTIEDFDAFVARASELGLEVALDLALQCAPDHPWVEDPPGVVHHARRRHDRLRREPAQEVPGHLPAQLRQRLRRALSRGAARRQLLDGPRRAGLPRRQPAHQARAVLGVAARARSGAPTPT